MPDQTQHFYQAIAIIQGILSLDESHPVITVGDVTFPAYASKVVRRKHQPGQVQNFRVYPCIRHKQPAFQLVNVVDLSPTPLKLNGCWELHKGVPYFAIYRNGVLPLGDHFYRNLVPVVWEDAPLADGQFWQAEAQVRDGAFVITKAIGPFEPPPKAKPSIPNPSSGEPRQALPKPKLVESAAESPAKPAPIPKAKPTATAPPPAPTAEVLIATPPLTIQEIRTMATPAKISLTCKLNQVPAHRELPDKQIEFFLNDGNDRIFTVRMKPKLFKKLTDHGFTQWVAAISGELGATTETGFELLNPAVQVFEKKAPADAPADAPAGQEKAPANEPKPSSDKAVVTARPQPPKAEAQAPVNKRKGLLQGVRLK
jgi:hypothetical protein